MFHKNIKMELLFNFVPQVEHLFSSFFTTRKKFNFYEDFNLLEPQKLISCEY